MVILCKEILNFRFIELVVKNCDYITLHLPYNKDTAKLINKETIGMMKSGARILNFARAELVDTDAMKEALDSGKIAKYVCDFPNNEMNNYKNAFPLIPFYLNASKNEELNIGEMFCGNDIVRIDAGKPEVLQECKEIIDKFYL